MQLQIITELPVRGRLTVLAEHVPAERDSGTPAHWEFESITKLGDDEELDLDDVETKAVTEALDEAATEAREEGSPPDEYFELAAEAFVDDECGYDPYSGGYSEDC